MISLTLFFLCVLVFICMVIKIKLEIINFNQYSKKSSIDFKVPSFFLVFNNYALKNDYYLLMRLLNIVNNQKQESCIVINLDTITSQSEAIERLNITIIPVLIYIDKSNNINEVFNFSQDFLKQHSSRKICRVMRGKIDSIRST